MAGNVYYKKGALRGIDLKEAMVNRDYALYDGDNFQRVTAIFDAEAGEYKSVGDTGGTFALVRDAPGLALQFKSSGTDDKDYHHAERETVGMFDITLNSGLVLAYEAKVAIVSTGLIGLAFGLGEPGLGEDLIAEAGTLGDKDFIGFYAVDHVTDVDVDGVYNIEGGTLTTGADTMTEDDDGEYNVYGFRFDGKTGVEWYLNDAVVAESILTAALFPTAQGLTPVFCSRSGEAAAKEFRVKNWTCVQLQ